MWGKMFGSSKPAPVRKSVGDDINDSIQKMRISIQQLDKREALVEKKIASCTAIAKAKTKAGDKKSAMFQLKKRKQLQKQLDGIQGKKLNLENQIMTLEEAHMNAETMKAMTTGAKAMKRAVREADLDKTDDLMADITEAMDDVTEMTDAMSAPMGMDMDEDDLEAEFAEFEEELADEVLMPVVEETSTASLDAMPSVPTKKVVTASAEEKEDAEVEDEFAELAAMMS